MTLTISIVSVIKWIIIGLLAGGLAGTLLTRGKGGFGRFGNLIVGLVGAVIGGFIFSLIPVDLNFGVPPLTFTLQDFLTAFIGAILFIIILRGLRRG